MKAQRRLMTLLATVTAFLLLFAACGGGGDDDDGVASIDDDSSDETDDEDDGGGGNGETDVDDAEFEDAMLEYAQCMRDNGVDMPDPDFDGEGGVMIGGGPADDGADGEAAREAFEAADEACQSIMDEVAPEMNLSPEEQAEMQDQFLEVAQCMRDKGHDMPDPEVGEDGSVMMRTEAADGAEGGSGPPGEEFQKDNEDCMEQAGLDRRGPGASEDDADDEEDDE